MNPARIALAVGGGYLLGRTKKLRLALTLSSLVAGQRLSGSNGLLGQGLDTLRSSPEFDRLREQLTGAGKAAAVSAATKSLGRVTERIEDRGGAGGRGQHDDDGEPDEFDESTDESSAEDRPARRHRPPQRERRAESARGGRPRTAARTSATRGGRRG